MYDFEALLAEVLRNKPQLKRESLLDLIREKKSSVGGGYLTDQGALFLIAGEFGIPLRNTASSDLTLNDLYIGANEITIVARILALYPIAQYKRKDGSTGRYRRINLFDDTNVTKLMIWDEALQAIEPLGLNVDVPVRVVSGYVRQGLDGRPNLNLGKRGRIEIVEDADLLRQLTPLSKLEKDVGAVEGSRNIVAVHGKLSSDIKKSSFVRNDGSQGSLTQFRLSDQAGGKELRIVIWDDAELPDIKLGQVVRVTNVRVKQQNNGENELHGDSGSRIETINVDGGRVFFVSRVERANDGFQLQVINSKKEMLRVTVEGSAAKGIGELKVGNIVEIFPDREVDGGIICIKADSIRVVSEKPSNLPTDESLFTKVEKVGDYESGIAIDVIALSKGVVQDVHLKDGTTARKGELTVGDDTGEVKVVAWRGVADKLVEIEPGDRVRFLGLRRQVTKMGVQLLEFTSASAIERTSRAAG